MIERIVDGLLDDREQLSITLKTRNGVTRRGAHPNASGTVPPAKTRDITFPGSTVQEAWRFTVLVRILELIHNCLIDNTIMTKRDMYYRHPDLFMKQSVVDRYVDDVACTLGISRSSLNVTAAAKGLVIGNFDILRADGTNVNGRNEQEGMLVPRIHLNDTIDLSSIRWILVIEKEATFRSLLCSPQWLSLGSQGLMLTAKGYPDLASREFLRRLADNSPHIPIFALVDFDPDGIAIMSTYKHGSYRLAHENVTSKDAPTLNLPQLRWLGVQSHQISRTPGTESDTDNDTIADVQGLMRLTTRDRMRALKMLEWDLCAEDGLEQAWRRELQTMLMLNIKAEMQILDELPGGLTSWLSAELGARQGPVVEVGGLVSQAASTSSDDDLLL
ncbi:DNA topoisomerase IV, alpha subunit [Melanomma pulvis-pyrius CBS 109.77]|uniref:DNA topoisomerase (ATP-hydrolyzing) n=1 Tax=Melanomma pulvis-pyrius CBS 109.77 TaxID=1314802 RepID=A0A6A6X021_9PLEO|nr:DNA topoisomerase IV, alpha subunit [Melanomma pulvis-pyrius CBS 109.77]